MTTATPVKPRYKTPSFEKLYRQLLTQATDEKSELYRDAPGYGNEIQKAFWETFAGNKLFYIVPNTMLAVAATAGKEWARISKKKVK